MPKIDLDSIPASNGTGYPAPFDEPVAGRWWKRLAPPGRLTEMGASHVTLDPGAWSSQRHWHEKDDELLVMLTGTAVLIEDDGETELRAGDIAAWPKGDPNGHHLINRSDEPCTFVAVSAGPGGAGAYSDIDMRWTADDKYVHKDGTPY
ncbi:MAG TPA: cupin domain-containing protein [Sphingomicrobium sp.]|nr:cupin domain-containing protein [Sphingomicrobium sp.]